MSEASQFRNICPSLNYQHVPFDWIVWQVGQESHYYKTIPSSPITSLLCWHSFVSTLHSNQTQTFLPPRYRNSTTTDCWTSFSFQASWNTSPSWCHTAAIILLLSCNYLNSFWWAFWNVSDSCPSLLWSKWSDSLWRRNDPVSELVRREAVGGGSAMAADLTASLAEGEWRRGRGLMRRKTWRQR